MAINFFKKFQRGGTLVTVIVLGAVFLGLTTILVSQVVYENQAVNRSIDKNSALEMAEAGLEKMRWYLAHYPQDYNGPNDAVLNGDNEYVWTEAYHDPITGLETGELEYRILPETYCDVTNNAEIQVIATSNETNQQYHLQQFHAKDSAASYAYVYNQNVRAGSDRFIRGRYHSNGTVQMDGQNDSVVSSSQTGGVFGDPPHPNARQDLWQDEAPTIDFNGLVIDLITIRDKADTTVSGDPNSSSPADQDDPDDLIFTTTETCQEVQYCYWGWCWTETECSGGVEGFEVELVTDSDSDEASIRVWELDNLYTIDRTNDYDEREKYCGSSSSVDYSDYDDVDHDFETIPVCDNGRENYLGEFALNNSCPVAFFEAPVFLYGNLDAKALIAVGDLDSADEPGVYLFNHVNYQSDDGSDGLSVVSEGDIKIAYSVPDDLLIRGVFIAQSGRYGRDNYTGSKFRERDFLQTLGSIVSDQGGGTQWVTSGGSFVSGFRDRENYYDRSLSRRPPPMTPAISDNYSYLEWRDEEVSR